MKNLVKKTLGTIAGAGLFLSLLVNPLKADGLKTIKYNDQCKATYSVDNKKDGK
jgi:hypothetical protein